MKITSRGFIDMTVRPEIENRLKEVVSAEMARLIGQGVRDERAEKNIIEAARDFLHNETGKDPIVVAMVTEVML
jgi:ribonuclease J